MAVIGIKPLPGVASKGYTRARGSTIGVLRASECGGRYDQSWKIQD